MSLIEQILPKKEDKKCFLVLCVGENRFSAATASVSQNEVKIIGTGESEFSEENQEIEACDIAISTAEKELGENILIEKVVFGLPVSFIEGEKIKPEYLKRLKKISRELSLKPHGFIEHPQAIAFYLEKKEESPPTLILISVDKKQLTFSFIRVGKIEKNFIIKRTGSFTSDFEEAITHFKSEILPSRILICDKIRNREQIEIFREELLSFPWHKHSSFLHTPKIEILEESTLLNALVETAGGSIIKELHLDQKEEEKKSEKTKLEETKEESSPKIDKEVDIFGFVKGRDISLPTEKETPKRQEKEKLTKADSTDQLAKELPQKKITNKITEILSFLNPKNIPFSLPSFSFSLGPFFTLLGTVVISIVFLSLFFWLYPKTTVNLIIYPLVSSKQIEVVFTTNPDKKEERENIIPANTALLEINGEKSLSVTGKKKIGEAASGEITLYNKTLESKAFSKDTILIGNDLKFTLDNEVNIASASDTGEGLTFGKAIVKITAVGIGPEGNLANGANFSIKDLPQSSYYAKAKQNLSGGSSREVSSVSTVDQNHLLIALSEELTSKAKKELTQKLSPGEKLLDSSIEKKVISKKFNKEIGEQAKEVNLSLSLQTSALVFNEKDLIELAKDRFSSPQSGFTLDREKTQVKIDSAQTDKSGDILAKVTISAYFYPETNKEKIKREIAGKSFSQAAEHVSTIKYIGGIKITRENSLPFLTEKLPFNQENISITISSQ